MIAVTLLTSTFQAAGEEYFFRGYLLQAVGALVRSSVVAVLVTTVLFTMAHGIWPWESPALFLDRFAFGWSRVSSSYARVGWRRRSRRTRRTTW